MAVEKQLSSELKIVFTDGWIWLVACDGSKMPITPKEVNKLRKILNEFKITENKYIKEESK